jgi:GNAT superfamily N-acetyltransferase
VKEAEFRPIERGDHPAALALWYTVFPAAPGYFERYFAVDPWYQSGDCLGAWAGDMLVSAVHVCRRPLEWQGGTLWCGAIANVATLSEYRNRGLSRELLRRAVQRMEEQQIDFSMLFTGIVGHYAPLGWEYVPTPGAVITLSAQALRGGLGPSNRSDPSDPSDPSDVSDMSDPSTALAPADALPRCMTLYEQCGRRPLALRRPEAYFRGWVGWSLGYGKTEVIVRDDGYAVLRLPEKPEEPVRLIELRSAGVDAERELLNEAARRAHRPGITRLALDALPSSKALTEAPGMVEITSGGGMMLRNVGMEEPAFREVAGLYRTGAAAWWEADGF